MSLLPAIYTKVKPWEPGKLRRIVAAAWVNAARGWETTELNLGDEEATPRRHREVANALIARMGWRPDGWAAGAGPSGLVFVNMYAAEEA